ncbi:PP-loop family-domain-containing protein [Roridomyces roridus]|uniref:tRNA(Ile)-lysidine synthetase n=1 Tax=Roridomyces roridus TaxID=1738132 RepID=A0AAD7BXJ8_9AGAR|nr:PP-loop family-domain-containing protein [Roridomyces roridus]
MAMRRVPLALGPQPVTRQEFVRFFQRSVANSGGADSTCLLFLIQRYIEDMHKGSRKADPHTLLPSAVVSLTVDHGMQASSSEMARHSGDVAQKMGVSRHVTSEIPWGTPPFPPKPAEGQAFEGIARNARYHLLFEAMNEVGAPVLATGHHGDDQVETSLMRLAKGTTEIGAGGMRRCRRWGMGSNGLKGSLGWAGLRGMKSWMIRPLLEVSKDRLLATCEEHKLEYVTDSTNFQPELTLRNAIRDMLAKDSLDPTCIGKRLPQDIWDSLQQIQKGLSSLESVSVDPRGGFDQLRSAVTVLSEQVEDIDSLVDSTLNRCHLPSPAGTCLVSSRGLATIRDPLVRRSLVLRIMRYVSFHGWGTLRADANRRKDNLEGVIQNMWTPDPFEAGIRPFVHGGGVLWTPVIVGPATLRIPEEGTRAIPGSVEMVAWLASRQPPISPKKMERMGMVNPLRVDVTQQLADKLAARRPSSKKGGVGVLEVLWDCRFTISMDVDKIPDDLAREILDGQMEVKILPNSRWIWPKVVVKKRGEDEDLTIHSTIYFPTDGEVLQKRQNVHIQEIQVDWIKMEWIRSLAA